MNNIISQMLNMRDNSPTHFRNSIKEVIQEMVLFALSKAGFFKDAVFYGGTALRICHGLDRFSEDLDFSLVNPSLNFDIKKYLPYIEKTLHEFGLNFRVECKAKTHQGNIVTALIKANLNELVTFLYPSSSFKVGNTELIKIKFEVDVNPPGCANFETKYLLSPFPFQIRLYDMPSLFASKIHAILCRGWKNRIKGRDLYDFIFFIKNNIPINIAHIQRRLLQSGFDLNNGDLSLQDLKNLLTKKFNDIDYSQAKEDVIPFIFDDSVLDVWSSEFFILLLDNLSTVRK